MGLRQHSHLSHHHLVRPPPSAPTKQEGDPPITAKTNLGFSGPDRNLTPAQLDALRDILIHVSASELIVTSTFNHGDCQGADCQAADLAGDYGFRVVAFPPLSTAKRGYARSHVTHTPAPFLKRNQHIVDASDVLIVATRTIIHARCRDGFCATARYARSIHRPVIVIYPDGLTRRDHT